MKKLKKKHRKKRFKKKKTMGIINATQKLCSEIVIDKVKELCLNQEFHFKISIDSDFILLNLTNINFIKKT